MADPSVERENLASQSSTDYLANVDAYVHSIMGRSRKRNVQPFIIELVDSNEKPVSIPFPPIYGEQSPRQILGVKLMVNPASLSVNMSKIIGRTQTMTGWVEEHWGDEFDTISFQGNTASFVTGAPNLRSLTELGGVNNLEQDAAQARADYYAEIGETDLSVPFQTSPDFIERAKLEIAPGVTTRFRRESLSYMEFKKLIELFSTNGCVFDKGGFVADRYQVHLRYDYSSYYGYFESIDVTEEATSPYKFTYTITFKAEKTLFRFSRS